MALNLKSASTDPGAQTRIASTHIWSMIEYVLNGVIFVLLGLQLPDIIGNAIDDAWERAGLAGTARLPGYGLVILSALIVVRLTWVWLRLHVTPFSARRRGDPHRPIQPLRPLWGTAVPARA